MLSRQGPRLGVGLVSFSVVASLVVLQQQREVSAEQLFQVARDQVLIEQVRARAAGLEPHELAPFVHAQTSIPSVAPAAVFPLLDETRIGFYRSARTEELQLWHLLRSFEQQQAIASKLAAEAVVTRLQADLSRARQLGVEDEVLVPFVPLVDPARQGVVNGSTVGDYRHIAFELKVPIAKLHVLIADQEATNAMVAEYAAQAAAQDRGDPTLARSVMNDALMQLETDLETAGIFQMDAALVGRQKQRVVEKASGAATAPDLDQLTGRLVMLDRGLQQAMTAVLPERALTISLNEQVLRAYDHGKQVWSTYVTTGRPGLETDPGVFKVYWKVSPWTMHSPWSKGDERWYPDTPVKMVMWFNGGAAIHDAPWRAYYGPGTEYSHYDPLGANTGTHGCVNVPAGNMPWLWDWTPEGAPVIVY